MSDQICTGSHLNRREFKEDEFWESFQSTIVSGQVLSVDHHRNQPSSSAASRNGDYDDEDTSAKETTYADDEDDASVGELSTLIENDIPVEDLLNMNIDMIPHAYPDKFYDCPSFDTSPPNLVRVAAAAARPSNIIAIASPRPYRARQVENLGVQFSSPPDNNNNASKIDCQASPRKQRPESARRISPSLSSSASMATTATNTSSSPGVHARTGSMLVQAVDDYNDIKAHAQSTPKFSDSGNPSSSGSFSEESSSHQPLPQPSLIEAARKTLDFDNLTEFQNAETVVIESHRQEEVSIANKENFYGGRYSKFVTLRAALMAETTTKKSPKKIVTREGKVKLLAGYFQSMNETRNKITPRAKSRIPLPVRKSSQMLAHVKKSPQARAARASGSPSFQTRKSYKLVSSRLTASSNVSKSSFSSNASESFLTRNQGKTLPRTTRVQSCSDATKAEIESVDETCKSHSTGDLSRDKSSSSSPKVAKAMLNCSKITHRRRLLSAKELTSSSSGKTPRKTPRKTPKKASSIMNRRSVGLQLKNTPVKPVSELCKLFVKNAKPAKPPKPANITGCVSQRTFILPQIVISRQ